MIWFTTKRRYLKVIRQRGHAEARLLAVQLRLARIKSERDDAEGTADALIDMVVARDGRIEELEREAAAQRGRAAQLGEDLDRAAVEVAELRRVRDLLAGALDHYTDPAARTVHVLVRDGRVHSIHRSQGAVDQAVCQADPALRLPLTWTPREEDDPVPGWHCAQRTLPALPPAPQEKALEEYFRSLEAGARQPAALPPTAVADPQISDEALVAHLADGCADCPTLGLLDNLLLVKAHEIARKAGAPQAADQIQQELQRRVRAEQIAEVTA
ncbi:hypothetical protein [Streptomyces chrestomyceticus]|uniref:hypothetical protein n=1 Tax=Streptomyces chrestomyceticus TaxID=68185 RepID=UPI0033E81BCA